MRNPANFIHPGDGDPRHGTANGYSNLGCRCPECTEAIRIYQRATVKRTPELLARNRAAQTRWREAHRDQARAKARKWTAEHYEQERERLRAYAREHPEAIRAKTIRAHGLTVERYIEMVADQDGACAICFAPFDPEAQRAPHIDHDHKHCPGPFGCAECVRGILCSQCNHGLGRFQDSTVVLMRAVDYLNNFVIRAHLVS